MKAPTEHYGVEQAIVRSQENESLDCTENCQDM